MNLIGLGQVTTDPVGLALHVRLTHQVTGEERRVAMRFSSR